MNKVFAGLCLLTLATASAAQLRVDVSLVNVVATVTDDRGRYVLGLTAEDFILREDGDPQKIAHFSFSDDLPVSMGILLDTSGSMENKISTASAAVERFLQATHPDDEIFLMTFANRPHLEQDFTSDRRQLASALRRARTTGGGTALYDALYDGVRKVRTGTLEKKALLLISDGEDSSSSRSIEEARREARRAGVLIYGLAISAPRGSTPGRLPVPPGPGRSPLPFPLPFPFPQPAPGGGTIPGSSSGNGTNVRVMEDLAESSGGRSWVLNTENNRTQMQRALDQIADELRNQYSIGYYPPHELKDGKWHRIDIQTKNSRYQVRARQDYFGE